MSKSPHLGKIGLVIWLIAPVVLVAILWTQMDRSRGKPDPRLMHHPASTATPAPEAQKPSPEEPAPKGAQPSLVEPESLPQGFVIVVEDKSKLASAESPIHLASSHNGWNPSDPGQRLTPRSDGRWQIVIAKPKLDSRIAFKFTRGNWATVEIAEDLSDIKDRLLPNVDSSKLKSGEQPIIEFVVPKWADQRPKDADALGAGPNRAVKVAGGRIQRVQVVGGGVAITRDLLVWLPPGYDDAANASRTYPVLYMNDGQNLFEKHAGIPDEWRVDETAIELINAGTIEPLIIVGIPNAEKSRISEYMPTAALANVTPRGDAYVEFVVNEVVPRIERSFRVKSGPENTAIGGSSLGGLISLYAGFKHPQVFGKVLAESPSLRLGGREIWKDAFDGFRQGPRVIFLGMGGKEHGADPKNDSDNEQLLESLASLQKWLEERKIGEKVQAVVEENATHTEAAWAERLPRALKVLFAK